MVIPRFARGLLALGITSLLGCGVTIAELQAENPQAATLQVHCHPWQIPKTVRIFAVRPSGDSIYTDETPGELRDFAKYAGAFIEVNTSAPPENAQIMASHYGLICEQEPVVLRSIDLVHIASKKGQRTIIKEADTAALKLADDLIQNHGQYPMAAGLEEMQTIMPYALGEKFTKGLGNKFQAHKIFERQALKRWKGSDVNFEKLPSVILTNEEHKNVTKLLNDAWKQYGPRKAEELVTVEQLRKIYRAAYQAYPHWLEIVESQLR